MKLQTFTSRLEAGKSNSLIYSADGKEGLIEVWKHMDSYIVTWEECPPGKQYDESEYTRDDRQVFSSLGQVLDYLRHHGIDPERFTP
jgi:hypothetical protein